MKAEILLKVIQVAVKTRCTLRLAEFLSRHTHDPVPHLLAGLQVVRWRLASARLDGCRVVLTGRDGRPEVFFAEDATGGHFGCRDFLTRVWAEAQKAVQ